MMLEDSPKLERSKYLCLEVLSGQMEYYPAERTHHDAVRPDEAVVVGGCGFWCSEAPGRPSCPLTATKVSCTAPACRGTYLLSAYHMPGTVLV